MKNIINQYTPFEHKNFNYINKSIELARKQDKSKIEGLMTSAVIYTNLAEYLLINLIENIQQMIFLSSYKNFNGVFYLKNKETDNLSKKTIGALIDSLKKYKFPDDEEFIRLVSEFSKARIMIIHRLMKIKGNEDLEKIDQELLNLPNLAEEILDKYNSLIMGITTIWNSAINPKETTNQNKNAES